MRHPPSSGSIANRFQYTAREFDPETGLYFYRARYYDPSIGRFIAEDPVGFGGGANFYRYVFNNSTLLADSTGLAPGATGGTGPVDFQIGVLQALFPGSSLQGGASGASLVLPMPMRRRQEAPGEPARLQYGAFLGQQPERNGYLEFLSLLGSHSAFGRFRMEKYVGIPLSDEVRQKL